MKKNNLLKTVLLFVFSALILIGCRDENVSNIKQEYPEMTKLSSGYYTMQQTPAFKNFLDKEYLKISKIINLKNKNAKLSQSDQQVCVVSKDDKTSYSTKINKTSTGFEILVYTIAGEKESFFVAEFVSDDKNSSNNVNNFTGNVKYRTLDGKIVGDLYFKNGRPKSQNSRTQKTAGCTTTTITIAVSCTSKEHHMPWDTCYLSEGRAYYEVLGYTICENNDTYYDSFYNDMSSGGSFGDFSGSPGVGSDGGYLFGIAGLLISYPELQTKYKNLPSDKKQIIVNNFNVTEDQEFAFFSINFFSQNPNTTIEQFQKWFIYGALDYTDSNDVLFAGNLGNLSNDLKIANQNGTVDQLQFSWPNWQKIKQNIKDALSRGVHDGAKIVKVYYDEVRNSDYYNVGTRAILNFYIDALREEIRQTTNMNKDTMKWEDLFKIWLFELMPSKYQNTINFTWASNVVNGNNIYNSTTNAVYTFPKGEPSILPNIKNGLKNGSIIVGQSIKGTFTYNFNQYYATLSNNNVGIQMLGSYDINATVISKSGNVATVRFFITNPLNWDSATRFVQNGTKTIGIVQNKEIGEELHLGGNLTNTYTWDEIITF
ncbi:hypothetical protein SDC9_01834 [bioreactor metagenome]|uniref:Uncharacterized protein n=1 Tax=bioreactor metagenome TaxID=1076179 RepID=A0A644SNV5_9ZZZZ